MGLGTGEILIFCVHREQDDWRYKDRNISLGSWISHCEVRNRKLSPTLWYNKGVAKTKGQTKH